MDQQPRAPCSSEAAARRLRREGVQLRDDRNNGGEQRRGHGGARSGLAATTKPPALANRPDADANRKKHEDDVNVEWKRRGLAAVEAAAVIPAHYPSAPGRRSQR